MVQRNVTFHKLLLAGTPPETPQARTVITRREDGIQGYLAPKEPPHLGDYSEGPMVGLESWEFLMSEVPLCPTWRNDT